MSLETESRMKDAAYRHGLRVGMLVGAFCGFVIGVCSTLLALRK